MTGVQRVAPHRTRPQSEGEGTFSSVQNRLAAQGNNIEVARCFPIERTARHAECTEWVSSAGIDGNAGVLVAFGIEPRNPRYARMVVVDPRDEQGVWIVAACEVAPDSNVVRNKQSVRVEGG